MIKKIVPKSIHALKSLRHLIILPAWCIIFFTSLQIEVQNINFLQVNGAPVHDVPLICHLQVNAALAVLQFKLKHITLTFRTLTHKTQYCIFHQFCKNGVTHVKTNYFSIESKVHPRSISRHVFSDNLFQSVRWGQRKDMPTHSFPDLENNLFHIWSWPYTRVYKWYPRRDSKVMPTNLHENLVDTVE